MARTVSLRTIARDMLRGSCIRNAVFIHAGKTTLETCGYVRGVTTDHVSTPYAAMVEPEAPAHSRVIYGSTKIENGMPLQGTIGVGGMAVEFYGSAESWRKLVGMG